jgi:HKD family nuclease
MKMLLHQPHKSAGLDEVYTRAFATAEKLYVVSAYLTEWDMKIALNPKCKKLRIIVGKDFGITRKQACKDVLNWIPNRFKADFLVVDRVSGFHPKAVFWQESDGKAHALIGSSNLTRAAFDSNFEANCHGLISSKLFLEAEAWIKQLEPHCAVVDENWISTYQEASRPRGGARKSKSSETESEARILKLPAISGARAMLTMRQDQMKKAAKKKNLLINLFRNCAGGNLKNRGFYSELNNIWSYKVGNRFQGHGFEIKGKHSDFKNLSNSVMAILNADDLDRDDVVCAEIDQLARNQIPTRRALLSEMLCQFFPDKYPVLNRPVETYLQRQKFKHPKGATEGARYIYLARVLRRSLSTNKKYEAKNLAELDAIIWYSVQQK